MEPDPKMNFTDKIRSIENQPVVWNKPAVWENVVAQLRPEKRNYWLAFAATIVFVLISFYLYYTPGNSSDEQLVENGIVEQLVKDNNEAIEISEDKPTDSNSIKKKPVAKKTTESLAINRIDSNAKVSTFVESTIVSQTDSSHIDAQVETDLQDKHSGNLLSTTTASKIEPIIGIMELRVVDQSTRSKRKKIIQQIRVDERTKSEEITTGIIIARLK